MGSFVSDNAILIAVICGVIAVVYGALLIRWLLALPAGDAKMRRWPAPCRRAPGRT